MTTTTDVTDEQRREAIAVLKKLIEGKNVDLPAWMAEAREAREAREREDRIKSAMQKQIAERVHAPARAATAATFRTDPEDLPTADQKADQSQSDPAATQTSVSRYSEEDMFVFTDDLGDRVR